jgi:signal transduction histidine kinase
LGNLIENALQHTPQDGRVKIQCELGGDSVVISVCDTGAGFPADELPHIFERFYRTDSSRQIGSGGRGLGLPIVKQIVEAHKGEVWVDSELGTGSCFYFCLSV